MFTNNAHLQGTATVPGLAIDVSGSRVLYADTSAGRDVLRIHDVGVPDVMVLSEASARVQRNVAFLTASGAIFEKLTGGLSTGGVLHEYRNGSLLTLGTGYTASLVVNGSYTAWVLDPTHDLHLRELGAGVTTIAATNAVNTNYDVTANGDVAYWTPDYQIVFIPAHGAALQISHDSSMRNIYPISDGTRVVFLKQSLNQPIIQQIVSATTAGSETVVSTRAADLSPAPPYGSDYEVNAGWFAYTKQSATYELQVWSNSPANLTRQVSFFGTSSRIESLGANGEIVFVNGSNRYEALPPYNSAVLLGAAIGKVLWRDGHFVVLMGGTVFVVQ